VASPVPALPRPSTRFDRLPAWQRAAVLSLTVLVICFVLLLGAEAAVRIRDFVKHGNFWGIDETYEIDPATGLRIPVPNGHFGAIHINSFGFRGPAIAQEKPPGRLRIAFLGGSTTYCGEVSSDAMTWPALVQKALRERWPGLSIDYINAGVPGYTIRSLLPALEKRVAQFKPDIIVVYEAINDLSANSYDLAHEQGVAAVNQEKNIGWLSRHSLLAYLVGKNIEVMRLQREAADSSSKIKLDMPRLDAEFRQDYINLVSASQQVAEIVATVTFAPRLRPLQPPDQRREAASTSLYYMPYMTIDDLLRGFADYNQVIRQVSETHGTVLVGDVDAIPADARHYTDSVHFTDAGSVAMADRVSRVLIASPQVQALVAKLQAQAVHGAQPAG
jgi:lysophospholipase L1-like esterase